tara:strand:- start:3193 stop:4155 length:963 start_codon:yes stop_codon:yes gene_type:complete
MTISLLYLAKPTYGGWVSFTAHLSLKYKYNILKLGSRTENRVRDFGYGATYRNVSMDFLLEIPSSKIIITAVDKHYREAIEVLYGASLVIHDPTEFKMNIPYDFFNIITIRHTVHQTLMDNGVLNSFKKHPFYCFPKLQKRKSTAVSISRIDFDKNIDIILEANKILSEPINIYGKQNELYVYHKLEKLGFKDHYKGRFDKTFEALNKILAEAEFMVDMSSIKGDGGGTQYTFLEAIYMGCIIVLNSKWTNVNNSIFNNNNCLIVDDGETLVSTLENSKKIENKYKLQGIIDNSKILLQAFILESDWREGNIYFDLDNHY